MNEIIKSAAAAPTSAVGLARGALERASANFFQKTLDKIHKLCYNKDTEREVIKMLVEKKHIEAIETVLDLVEDICVDTDDNGCCNCPFWHYCKNSDETPYYMLKNLFQKTLDK